jgi:hypothetical protein
VVHTAEGAVAPATMGISHSAFLLTQLMALEYIHFL